MEPGFWRVHNAAPPACAQYISGFPRLTAFYTFMLLSRNNTDKEQQKKKVKWQLFYSCHYRLNGLRWRAYLGGPYRIAVQCSQGAPKKWCSDPRVNGPIYTWWCWKAAGLVGLGPSQHIAAVLIVRH